MNEENKTYLLIVRQKLSTKDDLGPLLVRLKNEFGLDSYTARQRLTGQGLAMFERGSLQQINKIAAMLPKYRFSCWVVSPPRPAFAPDRLRSLDINNESIDFHCRRTKVRLERGDRVVAVLADVSGELNGKLVKRMINQKTYRGHVPDDLLQQGDLLQLIYQGEPVLDVYLLGEHGVRGAVRVLPGKFNHTGLGERGGLSSIQNLNAVRLLVEEYAGDYTLHTDFGLGHMPDCQIDRMTETTRTIRRHSYASHHGSGGVEVATESRQRQATFGDNLKSLTRYGWLVSSLQASGLPEAGALSDDAGLLGAVAEAAVIGSPALGAMSGQGDVATVAPGPDEIAPEMQSAIDDDREQPKPPSAPETDKRDLPAPPDRPDSKVSLSTTAKIVAGVIAGLTITLGSGGDELLRLLSGYAMTAGIVPAIAAIALFWSGFYFIFLKRQIENTPTSKIRSIAMGLVEVHGQARRVYALVAPLSHSACAWYRIRKYRKDSRDNWKLVREEDSGHVPFQIDDGTGLVIVAPKGASVKAKIKHTSYPGKAGMSFTGSDFGDHEKWVEEIVYEGTSVYVLGYAQPLRQKRVSLRERTMTKLRQLKLDPRAMRRYDANGDGQIDQTEWDTARSDAEQVALKEHLAEQGERKRQEERVVIARPPQRRMPFVVAETESEAHLTTRFGWFSIPLLLGGVIALVVAIYKFLQFMNI
jgi:hypothetical protein